MTKERIVSKERLKEELDRLKRKGSRIVFTNGCFDILHAGHVQYLNEARRFGDLLVVGLNSDRSVRLIKGDARPVVAQNDRAYILVSLKAVDYVTIFDEDTPLDLIEYLEPHVIVKGGDWKEDMVVGGESVVKRGGIVKIIPLMEGRSTTNLIEKLLTAYKNYC
ncbi:MAG: D-glycero-beta-D-manno-heptose 1-phosphate adenylyltransferase [Deltaproteobacteria bacterium]|nr:D-glycero-beta-D-manno-heptose 1-phosphate adenylyltransferase [Deltaproteobacteria bacterium]